jgi:hypothetical protein
MRPNKPQSKSQQDTTTNSELDEILERYFHYKIVAKDRQDPLYQALKQWAAQEASKARNEGFWQAIGFELHIEPAAPNPHQEGSK